MVVSRENIAGSLRERIKAGEFAEGTKLPSSRELASEYQAARNTANEALRLLSREGLLSLRDKSAAVVLSPQGAESSEVRAREAREEIEQVRDALRDARGQMAELEQRLSNALGKLEP